MKDRYRLFLRRKSVYYAFDNDTKTFQSLKTKDKAQATRLLMALNESGKQPAMNLGLARVYLKHSDPMITQRTWQHVFDEVIKLKQGENQRRWTCAVQDHAFDSIRNVLVMETRRNLPRRLPTANSGAFSCSNAEKSFATNGSNPKTRARTSASTVPSMTGSKNTAASGPPPIPSPIRNQDLGSRFPSAPFRP